MSNQDVKVLIIDDDPSILEDVSLTISEQGYAYLTLGSAEAARQRAAGFQPDLIISDIDLDGESGLELCKELKQDAALSDVPVIFLSGAEIPNIIRRAHAAGGSYYLRKPSVLADLVEKALWMPHLVAGQIG